ncbi:MAG: Bax inhibitor-1 family protein [Planctomycetota bacterium]|nr:US12 family protein [Planctomycetota bacterium]MCB9825774.1 US12 family protein [Planctomycetota bacterium]
MYELESRQHTTVAAQRGVFLQRTYSTLLGAVLGLCLTLSVFFQLGWAEPMARAMMGGRGTWLLVLGAFMVVGWFGSRVAMTAKSMGAQYAALFAYVLAEALILTPILYVAHTFYPGIITQAAGLTIAGFTGLTAIVFFTKKDFSFLGGVVRWGFLVALLLIVASLVFGGFTLGLWFSGAMVLLAGASVLYDTSTILRHFPDDRYVGAALSLFASVAVMFFYVLRLLMSLRD